MEIDQPMSQLSSFCHVVISFFSQFDSITFKYIMQPFCLLLPQVAFSFFPFILQLITREHTISGEIVRVCLLASVAVGSVLSFSLLVIFSGI